MEFNSELEIRQEIMFRLNIVYEILEHLIEIAIERNYNWKEGLGYQLNINKNDYKEIKTNFQFFSNLGSLLSRKQTTNYDEWQELITMVYSLIYLFNEEKVLFMTTYVTNSSEIRSLIAKIKKFVKESSLDPIKNSAQYKTAQKKLSLKQRYELALQENEIDIDTDKYKLNFKGKKDFILYSFTSAKYDLVVNAINKAYAKFLKENPDKIWLTDDLNQMLEGLYDDGDITDDEYYSIEAHYDYSIFLIEDVEDLRIITKNNDSFTIKESKLNTSAYSMKTIGDIVATRFTDMDYYYLILFGSPAYHTGVILLDEEATKEEILEKLTLIQVENLSLGFKFNDKEDYFDIGDQIKEKYVDKALLKAKKAKGKELNELFENDELSEE